MWSSMVSHGGMDNSFHPVVQQLHTVRKDEGMRVKGVAILQPSFLGSWGLGLGTRLDIPLRV